MAKPKLPSHLERIKSIRKAMPPGEKTFVPKKGKLHRKRKHKKLDSD